MARHISEIYISSYRGIKDLFVEGFGDINILVGDNNSGKTSLMEAIQILSKPHDFNNIVMVARQRDRFRFMPMKSTQSQYTSFMNIFNKLQNELNMSLKCVIYDTPVSVSLSGEVKKTLMAPQEMQGFRNAGERGIAPIDEEVDTFIGTLIANGNYPRSLINDSRNDTEVAINRYSRIMRSYKVPELFPMQFISSVEHVIIDRLRTVLRDKRLTAEVIELLQQSFDPQIQDVRILEEDDGRTYQAIDHAIHGYMPLSVYGDGVKKTIALAGSAAMVKNGVLLVDEYETAIHPKAMRQVFEFMIKICAERNLQLFLTTHSIEAVEKLLQCGNDLDNIRVITLYKNAVNSTARVLSGSKALAVKNELGLELRQ